jgi:uncharacterized surface protein with fasciclin (FAS1) repeats
VKQVRSLLLILGLAILGACGPDQGPQPPASDTVVDVLTDEGFTTLALALETAGLNETLEDAGPYTVFAPTNAAFEALPEGVLDALLDDTETLTNLLEYHVIADDLTASEIIEGGAAFLSPLEEQPLAVTVEGDSDDATITLNGFSTVTGTSFDADNGIVHAIDTVLELPEAEFAAALSGANEVPPVGSEATGSVTASLGSDLVLTIEGTYEGLTVAGPGAHIHGPADVEGTADVLFPLTFDNEAGTLSGSIDLADEANADIGPAAFGYLQSRLLYVNLHTEENPAGEIRGQLLSDDEAPPTEPDFTSILSGSEEVPSVSTDASGTASAVFNEDQTTLTIEGTYSNLSSELAVVGESAGHIHEAPRGENGDVVLPLTLTPDEDDPTSGTFSATAPIGEGEGELSLDTLAAQDYYINIHTVDNPSGEIRGQLTPRPLDSEPE